MVTGEPEQIGWPVEHWLSYWQSYLCNMLYMKPARSEDWKEGLREINRIGVKLVLGIDLVIRPGAGKW